jgi:hypothetical protein
MKRAHLFSGTTTYAKPSVLLSLIIVFAVFSTYCQAQEMKSGSFIIYLNAPSMTKIKAETSDEISIAQNAWAAELGLEVRMFRYTGISFGVGFGSVKDYNSFSQQTTQGEKESSFNTFTINAKAGFWSPPVIPFAKRDLQINFRANAGYDWVTGKREIDECADCKEEKYNLEAGFFAEPEINFFFFQNLLGIGTAYRYYIPQTDLKYSIIMLKLMLRIDF